VYFVVVNGFDITISAAPVLFTPVNRGSIAFGIIADVFADSARKHFEPSMCCPFWKKRRGSCSRWPYKQPRPFCASLVIIFVMPAPKITSAFSSNGRWLLDRLVDADDAVDIVDTVDGVDALCHAISSQQSNAAVPSTPVRGESKKPRQRRHNCGCPHVLGFRKDSSPRSPC
jgi:hypothetical protein